MNRIQANLCLVTVTICWASEAILLKHVPADIPVFGAIFIITFIGAVALALSFFPRLRSMQVTSSLVLNTALLAALGVAYVVCYTYGLRYLGISTGEFASMMTYVIIPMALLIIRRPVPLRTWVGIVLVVLGIIVAVGPGSEHLDSQGVAFMAVSCVIQAVYVVRLNDYAKEVDPADLVLLLMPFEALFAGIGWLVVDPGTILTLRLDAAAMASLFMCSIFVCGVAVALNVYAQKTAQIQDAIIIYALQIVFSTILAAILPELLIEPEPLTPSVICGCLLVCLGNLVSNPDFRDFTKERRRRVRQALHPKGEGGDAS